MATRSPTNHLAGESHPKAILTDADVLVMRHLHEQERVGYILLGRVFNSSPSTVRDICTFRTRVAARGAPPKTAVNEAMKQLAIVRSESRTEAAKRHQARREAIRRGATQEPSNNDVRRAMLFVLWHHQGAGSRIGQPIRKMLGIGQYDRLTTEQVAEAKSVQEALARQ